MIDLAHKQGVRKLRTRLSRRVGATQRVVLRAAAELESVHRVSWREACKALGISRAGSTSTSHRTAWPFHPVEVGMRSWLMCAGVVRMANDIRAGRIKLGRWHGYGRLGVDAGAYRLDGDFAGTARWLLEHGSGVSDVYLWKLTGVRALSRWGHNAPHLVQLDTAERVLGLREIVEGGEVVNWGHGTRRYKREAPEGRRHDMSLREMLLAWEEVRDEEG